MAEMFSLSEVFRIAEEIEANGVRFYTQAAESTKDRAVRQVCLDLAHIEKQHRNLFAEWRNQFCARTDAHWVDPDGQAGAYLKAFADSHIFNLNADISALLASVQSPEGVLRLAIDFEKDTIVFFSALKKAVPLEDRKKVELLISEELDHIRQLQAVSVAL